VSTDVPPSPGPTPETQKISSDDLARMLAASAMPPGIAPGDAPGTGGGGLRRKLLVAVLVAAIGVGASIMSCVGQSFSYRQARAMEGIEQQLKEIRAGCVVAPRSESGR
jgi:hypothetical protein